MIMKQHGMLVAKYIGSGAAAAAVNLGLTALLAWLEVLPYLATVSLAFIVATLVSFLLQKHVTFRGEHRLRTSHQMFLFYAVVLVNLIINDAIVYVLYEQLAVRVLVLDQALASVLIAVYSFFLYRHGVFKHAAPAHED